MNPPAITPEWKRKVAQDAIESLSAAKLARSICSQFRTRLNSSHEAFAASLRQVMLIFDFLRPVKPRCDPVQIISKGKEFSEPAPPSLTYRGRTGSQVHGSTGLGANQHRDPH